MHTTKILAALTMATTAVTLTACADPTTNSTTGAQSNAAASSNTTAYDVSQIPTDADIAALVPEDVKKTGNNCATALRRVTLRPSTWPPTDKPRRLRH